MKIYHLLALITFAIFSYASAQTSSNRMTGYIFSINNQDYISTMPSSTYTHYLINWIPGAGISHLCRSIKPGRCPKYSISYIPKQLSDGQIVYSEASLYDPYDDFQPK